MKTLSTVIILLVYAIPVSAQSYFFSQDGNDGNNGRERSSAWRTLNRLDGLLLKAGDSILLERGSTFPGSLKIQGIGRPGQVIYVGAYGTGPEPVISGSMQVHEWERFRDNIWRSPVERSAKEPTSLFINGTTQEIARHPNKGYLKISKSLSDENSFTDTTQLFADHFWDGAEMVIKTARWTIDNLPVETYQDKTFHLMRRASSKLQSGAGYFLQKHISAMDINGEWFFDRAIRQILLFYDGDPRTEKIVVEVSTTDVGLNILHSDYVTVEDLTVSNARQTGVTIIDSDNVTLDGIRINNSGVNGLMVIGCKNPTVRNSIIADSNNNGVEWNGNDNGIFENNTVVRTGLRPGRGLSGNGNNIGLSVTGANPDAGKNMIQYNRIDSTGYSGIDFRIGNTSVKNNLIRYFCMIKDDGAGVYTWHNPYGSNTIEQNLILDGAGSGDGTIDPSQRFASGVYVDDRSAEIAIKGNTIAFCGLAGIFIHNSTNIDIDDNRLFNNGKHLPNREKAQLLVRVDKIAPLPLTARLSVARNIFVSPNESTPCLYLSTTESRAVEDPGHFTSNAYWARNADQVIALYNGEGSMCNAPKFFSLSNWQRATDLEHGSSFEVVRCTNGKREVGERLMFDDSKNAGWMTWPDVTRIVRDNHTGVPAPSLKIIPPDGNEALFYSQAITLNKAKTYCLAFSAKASKNNNVEFVPLAAVQPWNSVGEYTCFSLDTTFQRFTYFFKPTESVAQARLNFKCNDSFWIDNVTLTEVGSVPDKTSFRLIFNDTAQSRKVTITDRFTDLNGTRLPQTVELNGYSGKLLLMSDDTAQVETMKSP